MEDVQGVLTLFCSGAAQVCHALRVNELREQPKVEEEDGDRQEEEVESGEVSQGECAMWMTMDGGESAQNLSHEVYVRQSSRLWKDACAGSVHARHASVEVQVHCVNVVIGVVLGELLVIVRVVPFLLVMML